MEGFDRPNRLVKSKAYQYRSDKNAWRHVSDRKNAAQIHHPSSLTVVTWNIDYQSPNVEARTEGVLRHLEGFVFQGKEPEACCIMLQEVHPQALEHLLADEWVRTHFTVTPISPAKWPIPDYGNVTLVSHSVIVSSAAILTFAYSQHGRGAVVLDLKLNTAANDSREITLRMINTHLESLLEGTHVRPLQLAVLASLVRKKEEVKGGVIVGDMNAIEVSDERLALDVGLKDAWRKPNQDPAGFTWGHQSPSEKFPPGRLDKVLYVERRKLYTVDEPRRIGIKLAPIDEYGVPIPEEYASDHYGLSASLRVQGYN